MPCIRQPLPHHTTPLHTAPQPPPAILSREDRTPWPPAFQQHHACPHQGGTGLGHTPQARLHHHTGTSPDGGCLPHTTSHCCLPPRTHTPARPHLRRAHLPATPYALLPARTTTLPSGRGSATRTWHAMTPQLGHTTLPTLQHPSRTAPTATDTTPYSSHLPPLPMFLPPSHPPLTAF